MARVYRFKDSDENIIRVGYTKNDDLRKRISSYRSGSQVEIDAIKNCRTIESVYFEDPEKAFDFEGFLIDIINPKYNPKHHGYSFDQSFIEINQKWIIYSDGLFYNNCSEEDKANELLNYITKDFNSYSYYSFIKKYGEKINGSKKDQDYWNLVDDLFRYKLYEYTINKLCPTLYNNHYIKEYMKYVDPCKLLEFYENKFKISLPGDIGCITIDYSFDFKDRIGYFKKELGKSEKKTEVLKEIVSFLQEN